MRSLLPQHVLFRYQYMISLVVKMCVFVSLVKRQIGKAKWKHAICHSLQQANGVKSHFEHIIILTSELSLHLDVVHILQRVHTYLWLWHYILFQ